MQQSPKTCEVAQSLPRLEWVDDDAKVFRHLEDVEVTVDGKRHFNKSWTLSVPRVLN